VCATITHAVHTELAVSVSRVDFFGDLNFAIQDKVSFVLNGGGKRWGGSRAKAVNCVIQASVASHGRNKLFVQ
jgi:hypothetical protein